MSSQTVYSEILKPKIDKMFQDLRARVSEIISYSEDVHQAGQKIAIAVASETATRSKTMLSDMYAYLSKQVLQSADFSDVTRKNKFYEANLRKELFDKYSFESLGTLDFKEVNRVYASLADSAGTVALGGILIVALSPASLAIPIAIVVAASVAAFCASYYKVTPNINKGNFDKAIDKYLSDTKRDFTKWFDEIERYFGSCVDNLIRSFNTQGE
ncbi:hypothetical protein [Paenibacillus sp. RC67]|uniref:hypothetical protein n=1 Tax=Paenibacillus sp. RC67 TaxID=3039392 RepID=UPI0024AD1E7C|nr:hypothetical protein [Paenibacillus sp. RC67]